MRLFSTVTPRASEVSAALPGDDSIPKPDIVMDRAFTLQAPPAEVWPWIIQLGKNRAGWYLPRSIELFIPPKKQALRRIDPAFQHVKVGQIIDDWGGKNGYFEVARLEPPKALIYKSTRGKVSMSWAIVLTSAGQEATRLHFRLRLAPVRRKWLAEHFGGFIDWLTIAGLAAGLQERLGK